MIKTIFFTLFISFLRAFSTNNDNVEELNKRPEVQNLLGIYSSLKNQEIKNSIVEFNGKNFSDFKEILSEIVIEKISPISKEINMLLKNKDYIDKILEEGSKKAELQASKKIKEMKKILGF